jgi:hypothetical protein
MLDGRSGLRMISFALLLPLLQEPAAAPAPPAAPPVSDPAAVALLHAIAGAQYAAHDGRELQRFSLELRLREFGETPHDYGFAMSYSATDGERLTIQIDDPERGNRVRKGFDGKRYWLQEGDGPLQDLAAREYEQDVKAIDEALELSQDLLLTLDLASLARHATALRLTAGPAKERLISGRVQRGAQPWEFTLVLPEADGPLGPLPSDLFLRQRNTDPAAAQPVLLERHVAFTHYKRFKERAVPQNVHEFLPEVVEPMRTLEIYDLRWEDAPLAPVKGALEVGER